MKRRTTFLCLLATIILAIIPFEGFAYKTNLYTLYGDHSKQEGGSVIINRTGWNNLNLTQVKASAFTYEATVEMLEGNHVAFIFGYTGAGFYGIELATSGDGLGADEVYLKGFRDGDDGALFFERIKATGVNRSLPIPYKIDVTSEGQLTVFVSGVEVHQYTIPNYKTGYLGVLSFQSKVKITNAVIDLGGEEGIRVGLEGLTGNFTTTKPVYTINRKDRGDNFVLSQTDASSLSIEGKVRILDWENERDRMSFVFGHKADGDWHASELLVKSENRVQIKAFKVGNNGGDLFIDEFDVNTTVPIAYKIEITENGQFTVYLNGNQVKQATFNHYNGGRWGMLTWNAKAEVSDLSVEIRDGGTVRQVTEDEFSRLGGKDSFYSKTDVSHIINRVSGNNMVSSTVSASAFSYEGKIQILEGDRISFVFGSVGNLGGRWFGTELRVVNSGRVAIKTFREGDNALFNEEFNADATRPIPFKIELTANGQLSVYLEGTRVKQVTFPTYEAGRLGFLTYNSKAQVSDVVIIVKDQTAEGDFRTNTTGWAQDMGSNGYWRVTSEGLRGTGSGNSPYFSSSSAANFIFELDMKYLSTNTQAGGPVFRANNDHSVYYAVDINNGSETVRILKFYKNPNTGSISDITLGGVEGNLKTIPNYTKKNDFKVRVEAVKSNIMVYINDHLLVTASDDESLEGFFGVTNYSSEIVFQDMFYTELTALPLLTALACDAELSPAYSVDVFKYNAMVPFETTKVSVTPSTDATNRLFVNDMVIASGTTVLIGLEEGNNSVRIKVQDMESGVSTITELNVKRRYNPETAYMERYRPQFHYTPEANWVNDPNGMVYYEGEYHLFYQYHPYSKQWGPMHWGHAISTDMVNWEEHPIALYPDKFGTMFSGSAVVDENNTSGFFTDVPEQKGLVAFYTSAGATQQQAVAYSKDKGRTWIKYKGGEPVIKTADDPMAHGDFRDPKVFWHEESGKWMMVIAGGPLRFYSSDNLKEWSFESGYKNNQTIDGKAVNEIHTECPDFFKLPVEGGSGNKWVLVRSSKSYMIGDFKQVNDKWYFIPDSNTSIDPNFGNDEYAGQTFSDMPDGRRVMMHWMTNFDYSSDLAKVTDPYNGAFTMAYELKLKQTPEGIRLYQSPVSEYEALRNAPHSFHGKTVTKNDENILKDVKSNQFEVVAEITPEEENSQFGFNLRTGSGQLTSVYYNTQNQQIIVNRTSSGATPNGNFAKAFSKPVKLIDGKLKLRIFVDWSSIEVFVNDGEALATALIFPNPESQGMEFFVKGEPVNCNIDIYTLKSIWREETGTGIIPLFHANSDKALANAYSSPNGLIIELADTVTDLHADLFNIEGKKIFSGQLASKKNQIPLSRGIYILKLAGNDQSLVQKVMVY